MFDFICRLEGEYASVLPVRLTGQEFLEMFDSHDDPVTKVKPTDLYAIKAPTAHPVYENFRVKVHLKNQIRVPNLAEKKNVSFSYCCNFLCQYGSCSAKSVGHWLLQDSKTVKLQSFSVLLTATDSDAQLEALGELMFQVCNLSNCFTHTISCLTEIPCAHKCPMQK